MNSLFIQWLCQKRHSSFSVLYRACHMECGNGLGGFFSRLVPHGLMFSSWWSIEDRCIMGRAFVSKYPLLFPFIAVIGGSSPSDRSLLSHIICTMNVTSAIRIRVLHSSQLYLSFAFVLCRMTQPILVTCAFLLFSLALIMMFLEVFEVCDESRTDCSWQEVK